MKKRIKKIVMVLGVIIALLVVGVAIFLQSPSFGRRPSGERLETIENLRIIKTGSFRILVILPI